VVREQRILVEVQAAHAGVAEAGGDLARLLRELGGGLRAEKVTISEAVQHALGKLRAAREHLETLEKLAREPGK
jgi:hypothetical protein